MFRAFVRMVSANSPDSSRACHRVEQLEPRCLLAAPFFDVRAGAGGSNPTSLVNMNGTLFFVADNGVHGRELWKSNGTPAGTVMVKDIRPGSAGAFANFPPTTIVNVNGTLFFTANNGTHGEELWRSDGTAAGTVMVKDIMPGSGSAFDVFQNSRSLTNVNGTLFFSAIHPSLGRELWKTDGTSAGTVLVKDIAVGSGYSSPHEFANVNGTLFFTAADRDASGVSHGRELWKSDGTAAGTVMVIDIYPGDDGTFDPRPENLTGVGNRLFFTANAGPETGEELWTSDGTTVGTAMVMDINPGLYHSSQPSGLIDFQGTLFFFAQDDNYVHGMWKSNGTAAGTQLVSSSAQLGGLTIVGSRMYFAAGNASGGLDLWKTDGTTAGTVGITQILTAQELQARIYTLDLAFTNVHGTLYFAGSKAGSGVELMKSDGTAATTVLAADIHNGAGSSDPGSLTEMNGKLFFSAGTAQHGRELWKIPLIGDDDEQQVPNKIRHGELLSELD